MPKITYLYSIRVLTQIVKCLAYLTSYLDVNKKLHHTIFPIPSFPFFALDSGKAYIVFLPNASDVENKALGNFEARPYMQERGFYYVSKALDEV